MAEMLKELEAMNQVAASLADFSKDEQRRIIVWLADFFDIYDDALFDIDEYLDEDGTFIGSDAAALADDAPLTWEQFYERVAPKTAIQKIVTAGYWLETEEGKEFWKSFETNKLLKALDVKVSSVSGTLALDSKKDEPLTETLSKSGDSMQARKTFRLSDKGKAWVEEHLA